MVIKYYYYYLNILIIKIKGFKINDYLFYKFKFNIPFIIIDLINKIK